MRSKRVLVIDDEPQDLDDTAESLRGLGYEVFTTLSPADSMEIIKETGCGIVFLDLVLPGMDGFETYARIKSEYQDMRFVIVTGFGYDPGHSMVNIKKEFDCPVLFKPVSNNMDRLKELLKTG